MKTPSTAKRNISPPKTFHLPSKITKDGVIHHLTPSSNNPIESQIQKYDDELPELVYSSDDEKPQKTAYKKKKGKKEKKTQDIFENKVVKPTIEKRVEKKTAEIKKIGVCLKDNMLIKEGEEYVEIKCSDHCSLMFHKNCWVKFTRENKEETTYKCPTPDCSGYILKVKRVFKEMNNETLVSKVDEYQIPNPVFKKEEATIKKEEIKKKDVKKEKKKELKEIPQSKDIKEPFVEPVHTNVKVTVIPEGHILDTNKILEDLKKKKNIDLQKFREKKKEKIPPLNPKQIDEVYKISNENSKYVGGEQSEFHPEQKETSFWDETEDDFFEGEIIFIQYNFPAYGLIKQNDYRGTILSFALDSDGNQSGSNLKIGNKVKFIMQENSTNCIVCGVLE